MLLMRSWIGGQWRPMAKCLYDYDCFHCPLKDCRDDSAYNPFPDFLPNPYRKGSEKVRKHKLEYMKRYYQEHREEILERNRLMKEK